MALSQDDTWGGGLVFGDLDDEVTARVLGVLEEHADRIQPVSDDEFEALPRGPPGGSVLMVWDAEPAVLDALRQAGVHDPERTVVALGWVHPVHAPHGAIVIFRHRLAKLHELVTADALNRQWFEALIDYETRFRIQRHTHSETGQPRIEVARGLLEKLDQGGPTRDAPPRQRTALLGVAVASALSLLLGTLMAAPAPGPPDTHTVPDVVVSVAAAPSNRPSTRPSGRGHRGEAPGRQEGADLGVPPIDRLTAAVHTLEDAADRLRRVQGDPDTGLGLAAGRLVTAGEMVRAILGKLGATDLGTWHKRARRRTGHSPGQVVAELIDINAGLPFDQIVLAMHDMADSSEEARAAAHEVIRAYDLVRRYILRVWGTAEIGRGPPPSRLPAIKTGVAGGPLAGKPIHARTKRTADRENPYRICVYCHQAIDPVDYDHATPKSKRGNNSLENTQLTCKHCNRSKRNDRYPKTRPDGFDGEWPPWWWPGPGSARGGACSAPVWPSARARGPKRLLGGGAR